MLLFAKVFTFSIAKTFFGFNLYLFRISKVFYSSKITYMEKT